MALMALDIAGNFGRGAGVREGIQRAGEERQARNLALAVNKEMFRQEGGGKLYPEIDKMFDPYQFHLGQAFQGVFSGQARRDRTNRRALASAGMPTASAAMSTGVDRFQMGQPQGQALPLSSGQLTGEEDPLAGDGMADGGKVKGYADGDKVKKDPTEQPEGGTGGGPLEYARDFGRHALEALDPRRAFPNYMEAGREADKDVAGAFSGFGDASARERGAMLRRGVVEAGKGVANSIYGLSNDIFQPLSPIYEGAMGALGFTGKPQDNVSSGPVAPDKAAAANAQAPSGEPPAAPEMEGNAGPPPAAGGAATPQQGPSKSSPFVGNPTPDQAAAQIGNIDISPDDMPSFGVRDWVDYRAHAVPLLVAKGMTPQQAHESISEMQHQGFLRYANQAQMMLAANNPMGAARALKAAYQYFPNGTDVKFGMRNGQLFALGVDEATGKQVGHPQAITQEYLAAMRANLQDPKNYLAWTKDWREDLFKEKKYAEIEKPQAQSEINYRQRALDIAQQNADTNEYEAGARMVAAQNKGNGAPTQEDYDRADPVFTQRILARGVTDPKEADRLAAVMGAIRRKMPSWSAKSNAEIADDVMKAYEAGALDTVIQRLGL